MAAPINTVRKTCNVCHGRGIIPRPKGNEWQICPRCGGKGYIFVSIDSVERWEPYIRW